MADRLLTVQEACEYLRVSRATLYRLAKDGRVPLRKVRGRTVAGKAALARIPRPKVSPRTPGRRKGRSWVEVWIDNLIRAGLVSPEDRKKVLHPRREDHVPIKMEGTPLSELVIQERRGGW